MFVKGENKTWGSFIYDALILPGSFEPFLLFVLLPPTHYRHLHHIVTNRLIVYVFCVTQGVTINSASHGGLMCAVKSVLRTGEILLSQCEIWLRHVKYAKGVWLTPSVNSLTLIATSLDREAFCVLPRSGESAAYLPPSLLTASLYPSLLILSHYCT